MRLQKILRWTVLFAFTASIFSVGPAVLASSRPEKPLVLTSPAFKNGGEIPVKYGLSPEVPGGENLSIPLEWKVGKKAAKKAKSFAVVMIDLHPIAEKWVHLMAVNIPKDVRRLEEGVLSFIGTPPAGTLLITNTYGFPGYGGPNPPPDTGRHVYEITLYALKTESLPLEANKATTWSAFRKFVKGKVVAKTTLKGKFGFPSEQ